MASGKNFDEKIITGGQLKNLYIYIYIYIYKRKLVDGLKMTTLNEGRGGELGKTHRV
jgi:hypothetical protein